MGPRNGAWSLGGAFKSGRGFLGAARGRGRLDPVERWVRSRHDLAQVSLGCPVARLRDSRRCTWEPQARCDSGTSCTPSPVTPRLDTLTPTPHRHSQGQMPVWVQPEDSLTRAGGEDSLPLGAGPGWRSEVL